MFSNYIKLAWRVLLRNPLYASISILGISFTLGLLMVNISNLNHEFGTSNPLKHKDDLIFMSGMGLSKVIYDTTTTIDTIHENGLITYDTTYQLEETGSSNSSSEVKSHIVLDYLSDVEGVKNFTLMSMNSITLFKNGVKHSFEGVYADEKYWEVLTFEQLGGRTFDESEVTNTARVISLSDKTAIKYFGSIDNAIDQEMEIEGKNFKVIGVFEQTGKSAPYINPDFVIPYTNADLSVGKGWLDFYLGRFSVYFQIENNYEIKQVKELLNDRSINIPLDHPTNYSNLDKAYFRLFTFDELITDHIIDIDDPEKSNQIFRWIIFLLLSFFICIPSLNLISLNISRILERSGEIGVRKSFGAQNRDIFIQFIVENIVLTFIGGIIGFGIALLAISYINSSGLMGPTIIRLDVNFFLISFVVVLIFGVMSGLIPAMKVSKLPIVKALKS